MTLDKGQVFTLISRHLDSRGDGTGAVAATGKYADSTVTFTNGTNVVNLATHGYVAGDGPFQFSNSGGALPTGITAATDYWVVETVAAGTFQVALTQGGTAVTFSDDGSGTNTLESPFRFYLEAQAGEVLRLARLLVHIEDATGFDAADYGNLGGALSVGVTIQVIDTDGSTVLIDLTDGQPVTSNADWGKFCYDTAYVAFGTGNDFVQARWTFAKSGMPLRLSAGQQLVVTLNDDFDGLDAHSFVVQGYDEATL
jgi:hypothetical protein